MRCGKVEEMGRRDKVVYIKIVLLGQIRTQN